MTVSTFPNIFMKNLKIFIHLPCLYFPIPPFQRMSYDYRLFSFGEFLLCPVGRVGLLDYTRRNYE